MSKQPNFANNMSNGFSTIVNAYYAIDNLFVETSEPFSEGSEHPVLDGKQQVSVDSAPSNEVESPGVASTGDIQCMLYPRFSISFTYGFKFIKFGRSHIAI